MRGRCGLRSVFGALSPCEAQRPGRRKADSGKNDWPLPIHRELSRSPPGPDRSPAGSGTRVSTACRSPRAPRRGGARTGISPGGHPRYGAGRLLEATAHLEATPELRVMLCARARGPRSARLSAPITERFRGAPRGSNSIAGGNDVAHHPRALAAACHQHGERRRRS